MKCQVGVRNVGLHISLRAGLRTADWGNAVPLNSIVLWGILRVNITGYIGPHGSANCPSHGLLSLPSICVSLRPGVP